MQRTITTTQTLTLHRPAWLRALERIQGKPPSKTMSVPIVGEVLIDCPGAVELELVEIAGKPAARILVAVDTPERHFCFISRVTLREPGPNGRIYKPAWEVIEELTDAAKARRAEAMAAMRGAGVSAQTLGEALQTLPENVAALEAAGAALSAKMIEELEAHFGHLFDLQGEIIAEQKRLTAAAEGTNVAKRRAGYAIRAKAAGERVVALGVAMRALRELFPANHPASIDPAGDDFGIDWPARD